MLLTWSRAWLHRIATVSRRPRLARPQRSPGLPPRLEPLEERRLLAVKTWTGLCANDLWDNPNNWRGGLIPTAGDDVVFPASQNRTVNYGHSDSFPFRTISSEDSGYVLYGSEILLADDPTTTGTVISKPGTTFQA